MLNGALAKRYARALFELAGQMKVLDQIDAELKEFSALLAEHQEMYTILNHPNIGLSDKKTIVTNICKGYSQTTLTFLCLLVESRRQNLFAMISREFARMADAARNMVEVKLISAAPLTDQQEKDLIQALAAQTGGNIRLIKAVDSDLIGGVKLQIGDTVIDGTVQTALSKMRSDLRKVSIAPDTSGQPDKSSLPEQEVGVK